jgi:hypothetical protein
VRLRGRLCRLVLVIAQQAPAGRPIRRGGPALSNPADSKAGRAELRGTVHDPGQGHRWRMQRFAQDCLSHRTPAGGFRYRVAMCQRGRTGRGTIALYRNAEGTKADYRNLQTCGSVWHCPICAPKIASTRVREMDTATCAHGSRRRVYFLTYTIQHDSRHAGPGQLADQLTMLRRSLSRVKGRADWRAIMGAAGSRGSIRALEVTYGEMNGWHSHAHEIRFADEGGLVLDREGRIVRWLSPLYALARLWCRELVKRDLAGLEVADSPAERRGKLRALLMRALTVQDGSYAAGYISEFGRAPEVGLWPAAELGLSHVKTARRAGHCSPWGLLADAMDGDGRSRDLFVEYATAFHGVPQLYWSRGLKKHFGIDDAEDDSLAADPDKGCTLFVALVCDSDWSLVLRYNARWELKRAAAIDGPLGVESYLNDLREAARGGSPPRFSGVFQTHPQDRMAA